ncbi:MAG: 4'-phosphopantetheinyl transferase superfamily protein [Polyangiaceae bacterium]|nr:4'-phosphopantetheinyl transferase superfamily protein [Polyangiaceae bacterium]
MPDPPARITACTLVIFPIPSLALYHVWRTSGMWPTIGAVTLDVAFDIALPHGRCIIVRIPETLAAIEAMANATLCPEELDACAAYPPVRRRTWVAGRAALRTALVRARLEAPAILSGSRGAPVLPPGIAGSISHKDRFAAALAAPAGGEHLGVDLEDDVERATDISSRVLCDDELAAIAGLPPRERMRELLVRFSAKEAIYKALDPFVRRYVAFKEISVEPHAGGAIAVAPRLPPSDGPFAFEASWQLLPGLILTTARVEPAAPGGSPPRPPQSRP